MNRIVTESKLNEMTGMSYDHSGANHCPDYQTIVELWGGVLLSKQLIID